MKTSAVIFIAGLTVLHIVSGKRSTLIPGEFIVQLKGTAIPNLRKELSETLKARGMKSCTIKPQVAEIKTHTWAFVHCQENGAVSVKQGAVTAAAVSDALRNTKGIEIERIEANKNGNIAMLPRAVWGADEVDGRRNRRRCRRRS